MSEASKNILVCYMSKLSKEATEHPYGYGKIPPEDGPKSLQTNETGILYLQDNGILLDKIFSFITKEAEETALPYLKEKFGTDKFETIDAAFDDDAYACMQRMAEMMKKLQKYKKENPDVKIHIDFTGGPRNASMLLLALFQLLKHEGFNLGRIIYTKYLSERENPYACFIVENAKELLQMFTLISGAEEFSRFGSATQINEYFKDSQPTCSSNIQAILEAMDDFSEKLKICSSKDNMMKSIRKLSKALDKCDSITCDKNSDNKNREEFFATMLPGIKEKYAIILDERRTNQKGKIYYKRKNIFSLIYWCADKGFLQQALTYYTEWIPKYLCDSKWLLPENDFEKKSIEYDKKANKWYDYLFTAYNQWNEELKVSKPTQSVFFNILNSGNKPGNNKRQHIGLSQLIDSIADSSENQVILDRLKSYQKQIKKIEEAYKNVATKDANSFAILILDYYDNNVHSRCSDSILLDALDCLYKSYNGNRPFNYSNQADRQKMEGLLKQLYNSQNTQRAAFSFDMFAAALLSKIMNKDIEVSRDGKTKVKCLSRLFLLHDNIESQVLQSPNFVPPAEVLDKGIPRDEMFASLLKKGDISLAPGKPLTDAKLIKLAGDYFKFKNEYRNRSNHAAFSGSKESNMQLQQEIMDSVRPLCNFTLEQA